MEEKERKQYASKQNPIVIVNSYNVQSQSNYKNLIMQVR